MTIWFEEFCFGQDIWDVLIFLQKFQPLIQWLNYILHPQLQKVFLPPGTDFLRRNFHNIEEEFS